MLRPQCEFRLKWADAPSAAQAHGVGIFFRKYKKSKEENADVVESGGGLVVINFVIWILRGVNGYL